MLSKEEYANKFGRWVEDNEIIIEDLSEEELLMIGEKLAKEGYRLEYWKAPLQKSGHLHIKDIQFHKCPEQLTFEQLMEYKRLFMKYHIPKELQKKVDWNFVNTKRHRIAEEHKPHFKGYGTKELRKVFGDSNPNRVCKDIYDLAKKVKPKENVIYVSGSNSFNNLKITRVAKKYGLKLHGNRALCPFHPDTNPSLYFSDEKGSFYCFGCQAKGGIIKFTQMMGELGYGND